MKKITRRAVITILTTLLIADSLPAQNVGIGTATPDYRLHVFHPGSSLLKLENSVPLANAVTNDFFFKTGTLFTGGIRTVGTGPSSARLGFFTKSSATESGLLERLSILNNGDIGIGNTLPLAPLHLVTTSGNPVIIDGGNSMFITLAEGGNNRGYIGSFAGSPEDIDFGTYGGNSTGKIHFTIQDVPAMTIDANGEVGIGTMAPAYALHVKDNGDYAAVFENTNGSLNNVGAQGLSNINPGHGIGLVGMGGNIGVEADANLVGVNDRYGLKASGSGGAGNNYGTFSYANGGTTAIGVFGSASGASTSNWAGYFQGAVFGSAFSSSDRKLKENILPIQNAISIINQLNPSFYHFKTNEYKQMNLPEGIHYGLIADEVQSILPGIVKKAVQPAQYENNNIHGKKISDPVEFNTVNYSEIIPILVGAVKEQQSIISGQQKKIDELEKRLCAIEKKIQ